MNFFIAWRQYTFMVVI